MKQKRLTKQQREDRALDVIIACTLRGWGQKEWEEVFRRMDAAKASEISKKSKEIDYTRLHEPFGC